MCYKTSSTIFKVSHVPWDGWLQSSGNTEGQVLKLSLVGKEMSEIFNQAIRSLDLTT
jgi:hypothetical protein